MLSSVAIVNEDCNVTVTNVFQERSQRERLFLFVIGRSKVTIAVIKHYINEPVLQYIISVLCVNLAGPVQPTLEPVSRTLAGSK